MRGASTVIARLVLMGSVALALAGCAELGEKEPRPTPDVVVEPPAKSDEWKQIATAADESRLARLDIAWQEALAEARVTSAGEIRRERKLRAA